MSPRVGSLRITNRAKWSWENSSNGISRLRGSATPGVEFIVASSSRSAGSCPAATGANTVNCDCGVTISELQAEVDQAVFVPVHLAEIEVRRDQPDFIADAVRESRRLGVVENDAFLAVEPARSLVDLGNDGLDAKYQNPVFQEPVGGIEYF